jgi:putative Mg2+ transporter-C (MgtC) family protein
MENFFYGLEDGTHLLRVVLRLGAAALLGGLVGLERERRGKAAGLRTHMLVTIGACLFVLVPQEAGVSAEHLLRVVQGIAAGIGFLGAGAILKMSEERKIHGLTTAANIWVTAAVGMAVGLGYLWPALVAVILAVIILHVITGLEPWIEGRRRPPASS